MKTFYGYIQASRGQETLVSLFLTKANNFNQARQIAISKAYAHFDSGYGWTNHYAEIAELPKGF